MKKAFVILCVVLAMAGFSGCGEEGEPSGDRTEQIPDEPGNPGESEDPQEPEEPDNSQKGKSIPFVLAGISGQSTIVWESGDKVKIYAVYTNASGTKTTKSATYYVTPDSSDPTKGTLAVSPGALDLRWQNEDEHAFYALPIRNASGSLSIDADAIASIPVDVNQTCVVTADGSGNYTASSDDESFYMTAMASADPQDVAAMESPAVPLVFAPIMTTLDIVIEGPSSGEAVITAVSITAETASEDALNHIFKYDVANRKMVDADKAPDADRPRKVSTLLSIVNSESDNPNSVRLSAGKTLKITGFIPPIATDDNRTIIIRPHTAGAGSIQLAHEVSPSAGVVPGSRATVNMSFSDQTDVVASNAWMSYIDDNVYVSRLSIPGTHDAATKKLSVGQCQSLSIEEQLDMGIRMFDLRPTVGSDGLGNIYHSFLNTGVSMGDVMTWFGSYLDQNPDEFIIAVMRWESERGGTQENFVKYMTEFLDGNSVYQARKATFRPDMTLGDCRGKILLISRTNLSPNNAHETAYSGWNHNNTIRDPHDITGTGGSGKIRIQDMYAKSENDNSSEDDYLAKKRELVKGMMDISAKYHTNNSKEWMISHCSGYTGSSLSPNYKNNAANVNPEIYSYLTGADKETGSVGIIMMDYVGNRSVSSYTVYGDLLPQAIIDNNFRFLMRKD